MPLSSNKKGELTASESRLQWQKSVVEIGKKIMAKVEVQSGFADIAGQSKYLERYFHFFDSAETGFLTFAQFLGALKKMNFLGCEREAEDFFAFHDDHCSGVIYYSDFTKELYNISDDERPRANDTFTILVEDIRAKLTEKGGASGYQEFSKMVKTISTGSNNISRDDLQMALYDYCGYGCLSNEEMNALFECYDFKYENKINILYFLNSLIRGCMSYHRKLIVTDIFNHFEGVEETGVVNMSILMKKFDTSFHPEVISDLLSPESALEQFCDAFIQGRESNGQATSSEFLDYFKGLSLSIKDDDAFDLLLRNIFTADADFNLDMTTGSTVDFGKDRLTSPPSSPTLRRLKITKQDGTEEIHEFIDDIGMGRLDVNSAKNRVASAKGLDGTNFDLSL
jgi:Ca2+-binding EF-hand superfamily protein